MALFPIAGSSGNWRTWFDRAGQWHWNQQNSSTSTKLKSFSMIGSFLTFEHFLHSIFKNLNRESFLGYIFLEARRCFQSTKYTAYGYYNLLYLIIIYNYKSKYSLQKYNKLWSQPWIFIIYFQTKLFDDLQTKRIYK